MDGSAESVDCPLVVDLDGSLTRSDLFLESFLSLLANKPLRGLAALWALRHGRAAMKARVAAEAPLDADGLAFNEEFIEYLRAEKAKGRSLYLASAADAAYVRTVAERLGLFDGVFASDGQRNLKGAAKASLLRNLFGHGGFGYAGNEAADFAVWREAGEVVVVNASPHLLGLVRRSFPAVTVIAPRRVRLGDYLEALRPHQWLKNLLVLVPAFTAHRFDVAALVACLLAICSFSLCASSVYLLNDLLDLRHDRNHPTKRHRVLASGRIDIRHGIALFPLPLCLAGLLGLLLPPAFLLTLCAYYALTLAYSLYLKRQTTLDVVVLACLYGMRLVAGAAAVTVPLSPWLLTFALFLFLSLALVKRWADLAARLDEGSADLAGRGYRVSDLPIVQTMAAASGYIAVLVFCLYIDSPVVSALYRNAPFLWGIPVILLYWISRILIATHRGAMDDDPVLFAVSDRASQVCAALVLLAVAVSI